jgi:KDO2-lipid IV(A) lauroyltransferase
MVEQLSYLAYLLGWKIVGALPEKMAYSLFSKIASRMYKKNGKSVRRLRTNLSIVSPKLNAEKIEALVQDGLESYMRYWCDTFRIHTWSHARIEAAVTLENDHLLRDPMNEGRGVVIALPHSGNWDHAGAYFCQQGIPLVTVAEILKPEKLFQKFLDYRTQMGFEVLGLDSRAFVTLIRRAREKRSIGFRYPCEFLRTHSEDASRPCGLGTERRLASCGCSCELYRNWHPHQLHWDCVSDRRKRRREDFRDSASNCNGI